MRRRAKSDTLYWLVKKLSNWQLDRLKLLNDMYIKDSLQWKLVAYYCEVPAWSREDELRHWDSTRLDVLKSRTLKWLVRGLSVMGAGPSAELLNAVADIHLTVAWDAHSAAFDFIEDAKKHAREEEQFEQLLEILRQELQLLQLDADTEAENKVAGAQQVLQQIRETIAKIDDLSRFHQIKVDHLFPYEAEYAKSTKINENRVAAIASAVQAVDLASCLSVRSIYEHTYLSYFYQLHSGQLPKALETINALLALYEAHPWLYEHNRKQYYLDLNRACGLAAELHEKPMSLKRISQLQECYQNNAESKLLAMGPYIKALLFVAYRFRDESYGRTAVEIFESNRQAVSRTLGNGQMLQVLYRAACFQLSVKNYAVAMQYLQELWVLRKYDTKGHFVHCRVMEVLCRVGMESDDDTIHQAANNAAKYINRQPESYEIPLLVCRHFDRLPSLTMNRAGCIAHIVDCQTKIRKLAAKVGNTELIPDLSYEEILGNLAEGLKTNRRQR